MFDLERLTKIISDIYRYPDDLERIEIKDPRDRDDMRNFYAVSMILSTLINRVIDLGDEIGVFLISSGRLENMTPILQTIVRLDFRNQ